MQQEAKHISHGLYLPFEIASERAHIVRFCVPKRSAGVEQ